METRQIPDLHNKALEYVSVRDERMDLTKQEAQLKDELTVLMKKHKRENYNCEGVEITFEIEPEKETVKVKVHKSKEDKEEA